MWASLDYQTFTLVGDLNLDSMKSECTVGRIYSSLISKIFMEWNV